MGAEEQVSRGGGVVVLAAFRPDPELFTIQLRSIRDQTRSDFRVLIGADGDQESLRGLVDGIVGSDPRFQVIGWDDNLGFYLNFERLLMAVPEDAVWVALSDQDDRWHPNKLERLLPMLDTFSLATGQARVVTWPEQSVLLESTARRVVPAEDLLFENQVTGAFSVFRRELLDIALPFPRLNTVTQLHDHWLALCAVATSGYSIVDEPLQDYVQHGANLVGEVATHRGWTPWAFVRRIVELGDTYEGGHSLAQCARACQVQSFEWRRVALAALCSRLESPPPAVARTFKDFDERSGLIPMVASLYRAVRSDSTSPWVVATFLPGIPVEAWRRGRGAGLFNKTHPLPSSPRTGESADDPTPR